MNKFILICIITNLTTNLGANEESSILDTKTKTNLLRKSIGFVKSSQIYTESSLNRDTIIASSSLSLCCGCFYPCYSKQITTALHASDRERAAAESLLRQANQTLEIIQKIEERK